LYSQEYTDSLTGEYKPACEAYLSVSLEITEELDSFEFEYNKQLFSHSLEVPLDLKKCTPSLHLCNLKITCLKDFDREQEICVYTHPKGSRGKSPAERNTLRRLAGRLKVLLNSEKHRKELKVLVTQLQTDVMNDNDKKNINKDNFPLTR
jgi:hypothetical protein